MVHASLAACVSCMKDVSIGEDDGHVQAVLHVVLVYPSSTTQI